MASKKVIDDDEDADVLIDTTKRDIGNELRSTKKKGRPRAVNTKDKNKKRVSKSIGSRQTKAQLLQVIEQLRLQIEQQQTSYTQRTTAEQSKSNSNITTREVKITEADGRSRSDIITVAQTIAFTEKFIREEISTFTNNKIRPAFEGKTSMNQSPFLHMIENRLMHARTQNNLLEYRPGSLTSGWGQQQQLRALLEENKITTTEENQNNNCSMIRMFISGGGGSSGIQRTLIDKTQDVKIRECNESSKNFQIKTEKMEQQIEKNHLEQLNDNNDGDDVLCVTNDQEIIPWKDQILKAKTKKEKKEVEKMEQECHQSMNDESQGAKKRFQIIELPKAEMKQLDDINSSSSNSNNDDDDDDDVDIELDENETKLRRNFRQRKKPKTTIEVVKESQEIQKKLREIKLRRKKNIEEIENREVKKKDKNVEKYALISAPQKQQQQQQQQNQPSIEIFSNSYRINSLHQHTPFIIPKTALISQPNIGSNTIAKRIVTNNGILLSTTTPEEDQMDREHFHNSNAKPTPAGPGYYLTVDTYSTNHCSEKELEILNHGIKANYPIFRGLNTFAEDFRLHGRRKVPPACSDYVIHTGSRSTDPPFSILNLFRKKCKRYFNNHFDFRWQLAYYQPITVDQLLEMVLVRYVARMNHMEMPLLDEEEFYEPFPILFVEVDTKEESHNNTDEIMSTRFGGVQHIVPQSCMKSIPLSGLHASISAYDAKEKNSGRTEFDDDDTNMTYLHSYRSSENIKKMYQHPDILTNKPHEQFCEEEFYVKVSYRVPNNCNFFKLNQILRCKYATLKTMQSKGINIDKSLQELKREYQTDCLEQKFFEAIPTQGTETSSLVLDLTAIAALMKYIKYVEYKKKTRQKRLSLVEFQNDSHDIYEQIQKLEQGLTQAREIRYREIQQEFKQDFGEIQNKLVKAHLEHMKKEKQNVSNEELNEGELYDPTTKSIKYDFTKDKIAMDYLNHNPMC